MLELIINNLKTDKIGFHELSGQELGEVLDYAVANQDFAIQKKLGNHFTGIYDNAADKPYWLKSTYSADKTIINFGVTKNDKILDWSTVKLDDGLLLTSPKHTPLLNAFKNWLLAVTNPLENGGNILKSETAKNKLLFVITLIDAILLHADTLELAQYHLSSITDDFWFSILKKIAEQSGVNGVYNFQAHTKKLLEQRIQTVSDEEAEQFTKEHPFIGRDIASDDMVFSFSKAERAKACYWLHSVGFYKIGRCTKPQGNGAILEKYIFEGKIISPSVKFPKFPELWLEDIKRHSEYQAVENYESSDEASEETIKSYVAAIKLINTNITKDYASSPSIEATKTLSIKKIHELTSLKGKARTRTQHPDFVFKLTRQSFEFIFKHQKDILSATLSALTQGIKKTTKNKSNQDCPAKRSKAYTPEIHDNIARSERLNFMQTKVLHTLDESIVYSLGITQVLPFEKGDATKFELIRDSNSLFELYRVLTGASQFVLGTVSARRQGELLSLKSYGNLSPNLNPFDDDNKNLEYSLVFKLKKSGNGGNISSNKTIERPITTSIAKIIWRLEEFNKRAISLGIFKGKTLTLFSTLTASTCTLSKSTKSAYNERLDNLCDYFETDLVLYDNGEFRRNYVRQHQLRRFFALLFFWQKRFQGLEALRWMLGHTDMAHLWHYISGKEMGDVLNGVKACVIVNGVLDKDTEYTKIKTIEELRKVLAKRYNTEANGNTVFIDTLDGTMDAFDEDDISVPHISSLRAESTLEANLEALLENGEISLEPNFFTIVDENGKQRETFNLAFQVKCGE
ncbi:hypothetical protein [Vibrio parahaemolyticus]|uniref:hypothetical protein n=1 Tax=Vibrio parahaemolyticus TaxID=670 RepID=UPI000408FFA7|nr:hypothetical protein [Vibrio parahaemolyticus]EJC1445662.1 integrase [Vibrio parahaemolyticus]EJI1394432.1 integrase [Vibrio parahaemolyticus]